MRKSTFLIIIGIILAVGGPVTGVIISTNQEAQAAAAFHSGAPPEASAHHMRVAMIAEAIGYTACPLGLVVLITGVVMRAKRSRAHTGSTQA